MMAEIDVARPPLPKIAKCPQSAAALPSFRYITGLPSFVAKPPLISNPAQSACTKFVRPERAQDSRRAGRTRRIQTDYDHIVKGDSSQFDCDPEPICDLLQAHLGAFLGSGRMLEESLDKELLSSIYQGVIDGGSAEVHSCDYLHAHVPF